MNCLELRRAALTDPHRLDAGTLRHAEQCPACMQFLGRGLEAEARLAAAHGLEAAMVPAAAGSVAIIGGSARSIVRTETLLKSS